MDLVNCDEFTWFFPRPKGAEMSISIPNQKNVNFNPKAMEKMPPFVVLGASSDGKRIGIREQTEKGYKLPKSGSIKDEAFISFLQSSGVKLPAKYELCETEGGWIGNLVTTAVPKVSEKRTKPRISKSGADSLIKEIESL